ncbi:MAG: 4Fe-4S dicluster domain-containing protein [Pseudomonadota bacterium]
MDQKELRALESHCIQEEPPECVAACPIHVDARSFIRHILSGDWKNAAKTLHRTLPVPGILGRICDAPCRERCKRKEIDDPIHIGALERCCVETIEWRAPVPPISPKEQSVGIVGSGIGSLTVAWDLCRKGYAVTIFEPGSEVGGHLLTAYPDRLLPEHIDPEIEVLRRCRVRFETGVNVWSDEFLQRIATEFDAVYLGLDAVTSDKWSLARHADGRIQVAEKLQGTSIANVFAGGNSRQSESSPVWRAAEGRFAATSIDRLLQRVSMTAGREKEGPHATRLFTDISHVPIQKEIPISDVKAGCSQSEAVAEAGRCLLCECLECVKQCVYLERFGAYPKKYAREIYNNESLVMGARQANKLINSCSLCGLCETLCPENFAMQDLCLGARQRMVESGKMPASAHEFALTDLSFSESDQFALSRHEPDHDSSAYAFFPGCQLCASSPETVFETYRHLRRTHSGGVGLILGCCGAPAHWAGHADTFKAHIEILQQKWEDLGKPHLILCCPTCDQVFRENLKEVPTISLWRALLERGLPEAKGFLPAERVSVHDPCTSRHEPELQKAVRELLDRISVTFEELPLSREKTECCGFGGLMQFANPELAREVAGRRSRESECDYVTYCAMCRDNLAGEGKRILHLLDFIFPQTGDPMARKRPGWSDRRENRERLKERFLTETWKAPLPAMSEEHRHIPLSISPEVASLLERRRILREDIQKVLYAARQTGRAFYREETGRYLSSLKPYHVTFWVEYTPEEDRYVIHNAYAHRMEAESA